MSRIAIENGRGRRSECRSQTRSQGNADSLQCDHPIPINVPCHSTGDRPPSGPNHPKRSSKNDFLGLLIFTAMKRHTSYNTIL